MSSYDEPETSPLELPTIERCFASVQPSPGRLTLLPVGSDPKACQSLPLQHTIVNIHNSSLQFDFEIGAMPFPIAKSQVSADQDNVSSTPHGRRETCRFRSLVPEA